MARDDDGRTSRAKAPRGHRADSLCRDHAPAGLCGDRPLCGSAGPARQIHPHRHHGDGIPGLGPDAVAGNRIRDAGVLRPRRSRSDHVVADPASQRILGSHRRDRAVGDRDGAVAVNAFCRCSRDRWWRQMVFSLRRRHGDWIVSGGGCDCSHDRVVSIDRSEPDAAGGANFSRDHRRRFRHRAADGRDPVLQYAIAVRGSRAPRLATAKRCCSCWRAASSCLAPRWRYSRRGLPRSSSALRRMPRRPVRAPARPRFARVRGNRRCGGRNSCCCGATRGWCRRP